ncbi:hypothetical protein MHH33_12960 [Paenisporosarcina sp. FSL H8-0542]|uniref:hypothetical protein n=1 Tax=unclassified Paenisporosarcina TaxID=2642018 RepID=UPI00034E2895|nr:hypothetical protein [Paenisporosarcina sp. HGH0030]EPD52059.1 hypothetical protein HMPREF1210_01412 [Paenisporosarcina sp. HGH0030]
MALTDEQFDLLLEDEELEKYIKEYQDYKMTYRDCKAKRDNIYKRHGIEVENIPINHQERMEKLEELLDEGYIDKANYEKKLKRIEQDIKDDSYSLEKKKQLGIEIDGCVFADNGDIDLDDFLDKFIEFVESNGWHYGGGTNQVDEDGNNIK